MRRFSTLIFAGLFVIGAACSSSTTTNENAANANTTTENTNGGALNTNTSVEVNTNTDTNSTPIAFSADKKSAHYISNSPVHASTLPTPPASVSINFNFDLSEKSTIEIIKDGRDYGMGLRSVTNSQRTLAQTFDATAPDGLYTVQYNACWPDGSCHTGNFQFALERPA